MGGGDKPLRLLAGRPVIAHIVARLSPQVSTLALSANGDPLRLASWDLPVVADTIEGHLGPLAGVLAGLAWLTAAHPGISGLLTVPGDTPFLPFDLVDRLVAARNAQAAEIAIAASSGRTHPVVALWPVGLARALNEALAVEGLRKVEAFVSRYRVAVVDYPAQPIDPFFNINTEADLTAAALAASSIAASAKPRSS